MIMAEFGVIQTFGLSVLLASKRAQARSLVYQEAAVAIIPATSSLSQTFSIFHVVL